MNKYKNLYTNGCSFTAGHELKDEERWTVHLSKLLNLEHINMAANGQSMDSIILNSVANLTELDPRNTIVVIGLTWKERFGFLINKTTVNITPEDIGYKGNQFHVKFSTWRRSKSPLSMDAKEIVDTSHESFLKEKDKHYLVLEHFSNYYKALVDLDLNLELDLATKYVTNIVLLQSYLKEQGFEYRFVEWDSMLTQMNEKHYKYREEGISIYNKELLPLYNKIDLSKVINFKMKYTDYTSHPDAKQSIDIANVINKKIKSDETLN